MNGIPRKSTQTAIDAIVAMLGVVIEDGDFALTAAQLEGLSTAHLALCTLVHTDREDGMELLRAVGAVTFLP